MVFRNYCNMERRPWCRTGLSFKHTLHKWGFIAKEQGGGGQRGGNYYTETLGIREGGSH